ncbi:uncharacterized protein LOC129008688 [Pongo pygmaeus]|uniref:uncharacterized protein LOC129008688 n=1 Tax=Pongo pygmaeus TaxID=9600 RepID=UPI00300C4C96
MRYTPARNCAPGRQPLHSALPCPAPSRHLRQSGPPLPRASPRALFPPGAPPLAPALQFSSRGAVAAAPGHFATRSGTPPSDTAAGSACLYRCCNGRVGRPRPHGRARRRPPGSLTLEGSGLPEVFRDAKVLPDLLFLSQPQQEHHQRASHLGQEPRSHQASSHFLPALLRSLTKSWPPLCAVLGTAHLSPAAELPNFILHLFILNLESRGPFDTTVCLQSMLHAATREGPCWPHTQPCHSPAQNPSMGPTALWIRSGSLAWHSRPSRLWTLPALSAHLIWLFHLWPIILQLSAVAHDVHST